MVRRVWAVCIVPAVVCLGAWSQSETRRESLEHFLRTFPPTTSKITGRINATDKTWEDWVRRTGELPPDWSTLPRNAFLPDPLKDNEGQPVRNADDWKRRKQWIRQQYEHWIFGTVPPAPDNLRAVVTSEQKDGELTIRNVRLEFGPDHKATLRVQLLMPSGNGPFPVFLTNHPRTRPWVATAVRRGYIGAIYYAADPIYGNADDSDRWIEVYPQYDWSCLARWAWAGMRTVDYLLTLPQVDRGKIAITGHSRNGKQALLAAAFDDRIAAVALSSGNTGEGAPWRFVGDQYANESTEQITEHFPHWFHPRLRFFSGRENQLPVDQNLLMSMVAPRALLMASSYSEGSGAPFGFEQAYRSVREVYRWLGASEKIGLYLRDGEHPTTAEDIEQYVDFFDGSFGRGGSRPEQWVLGFDWDTWRKQTQEHVNVSDWAPRHTGSPALKADEIRRRIRWSLGDEPTGVPFPVSHELHKSVMTNDGPLAFLYGRPHKVEGAAYAPVAFGDDLKADFYYPAASGRVTQKFPVVIFLHGFSHSTGYSKSVPDIFVPLIRRGFAVLSFDQIGFGTRILWGKRFYERYPHWSLLGKMVADTEAAVDAAAALPNVDPARIYLLGESMGSRVALYTAALDAKVAGVALMGGIAPLRLDRPEKGTEGVQRWAQLHGLQPRLGFFKGQEARLPIDDDDLLQLLAPRPVMLVAPKLDRYSPVRDVEAAVRSANRGNITLETPDHFDHFPPSTRNRVFDWLGKTAQN